MNKQYYHRPQSASSKNSKPPQRDESYKSHRVHTQEKQTSNHVQFAPQSCRKSEKSSIKQDNKSISCSVDNPQLRLFDRTMNNVLCDDRDWGKHLKNQCLCKLCTCGKHICHLHPVKLGLTIPESNYASNYKNRGRSPNERIHIPSMKAHDPLVVDFTQYKSQYPEKKTHLEQPTKYDNNLKTGGPMINLTTYNQTYIPKNSPNQYLEVDHGINFPLNTPLTGTTNYRNTYKWRNGRPSVVVIAPDLMPVQSNLAFLGKSSYQNDYQAPKKDQYPQRIGDGRRANQTIGLGVPRTTYQRQFANDHLTLCPAEIQRRRVLHQSMK